MAQTLADALNLSNPNDIANVIQTLQLGTGLAGVAEHLTQSAAVTLTLSQPALYVSSCHVFTGGAATVGDYAVAQGVTANDSNLLASLSADGLTITFAATVTSVTVQYVPMPTGTALNSVFNTGN